jgi:localization factor PodJL
MKSGGPWNLRGLRPEARETARGAARRSGVSVGEWLNSVIETEDDGNEPARSAEFDRAANYDRPRYPGYDDRRDEPTGRNGDRSDRDYGGRDRYPQPDRNGEPDREQQRGRNQHPDRDGERDRERDRHREHGRNRKQHHVREQERERERTRERERERIREQERERDRNRAREQERIREQERKREQERMRAQEREREQERMRAQEREREQERIHQEERLREEERIQEEKRLREEERDRESDREGDQDQNSETAETRDQLGQLHGRLDQLSEQLERLTRTEDAQRKLFMRDRQPSVELGGAPAPNLTGAPAPRHPIGRPLPLHRPTARNGELSIDQAVAEISARQRTLEGAPPVKAPGSAPVLPALLSPLAEIAARQRVLDDVAPVVSQKAAAPPVASLDLGGLERQLRDLTARIEELRPSSELAETINAVRNDLAEIARQLNEALPRRAVEPLEIEIKALAQRIDQSRQSGVDASAIAGLERGLAEVCEALRGLTTSESLVGFDDAVQGLSHKLDLIAAKDDPAALQQLETAIGALRGIVSHVASNDTLTKVADDVRSLAAKVDALGNAAVSAQAVSALESRIEALVSALTASTEAGHAVPRELEKLLSGLIEKLEWVQLTHTDHAALAHLEDRIATLVKRFDASDARLVHIEAVERGLADLLVHLDEMRSARGNTPELRAPVAVGAIERDVAEIRQSERRTQDSLEAVQGTVEQVVDRLAMIESDMRSDPRLDSPPRSAPVAQVQAAAPDAILQSFTESAPMPAAADLAAAAAPALAPAPSEPTHNRTTPRRPIDPSLPPDHPLEPGSAANRSRPAASAADRIAASEAAIGSSKPPVIPDPGRKPDFIAAARRAAQVAAATPSEPEPKAAGAGGRRLSLPKNMTQRLRTLLVAGSAVIIVLFCLHIASRLFEDGGSAPTPEAPSDKVSPPAVAPSESDSSKLPAAEPTPAPNQGNAPTVLPSAPSSKSGAATGPMIGQQSMLHDGTDQAGTVAAALPAGATPWGTLDVTGSLPQRGAATATTPSAPINDNLPATIGGPILRAAAMAGDAPAAYEVAMRFAEGRGVPQNDEAAERWLESAARAGLPLAQFRLGTFYEKGTAVKKDLAVARDLYLAAANRGNGKAMHNLAVLYAEGINGPADYRTAAHWFSKAADHGIPDSQYNLGILYARGIGVQQNFAESYKWFALAANQGDNEAAKKRDEVAEKLDPQSLTAARLAVQTWSAQPQPDDAISVKAPPGGWDVPVKAAQPAKSKPRSNSAAAAAPNSKAN